MLKESTLQFIFETEEILQMRQRSLDLSVVILALAVRLTSGCPSECNCFLTIVDCANRGK